MNFYDLVNIEQISIINIPNIHEKWIQDYIASDPSVLGLGDIELKPKKKFNQMQVVLTFYYRTLKIIFDMKLNCNWEKQMKVI